MKHTSIFIFFNLLLAIACFSQNTLRMASGQRLDKGQKIQVAGKGYLYMQGDGNLVFYTATNQPKWATMTHGKTVTHCIMQTDGNLVIYNNTVPVWASDTWNVGANGGYFEIDPYTFHVAIYKKNRIVAKVLQQGLGIPPPPPPSGPDNPTTPIGTGPTPVGGGN
jgi:hypothetical protein